MWKLLHCQLMDQRRLSKDSVPQQNNVQQPQPPEPAQVSGFRLAVICLMYLPSFMGRASLQSHSSSTLYVLMDHHAALLSSA